MVAPLQIGSGIGIEQGIKIGNYPVTTSLLLNLDANTYDNTTTDPQQNVSGTSDNIGFFPYGWPAYSVIQPGWTCVQTGAVVTVVDGVNHVIVTVGTPFTSGDSYTFTGANSWIDSVSNLPFILFNGVTLSNDGGNSLSFTTASSQYAQSSSGLGTLNTWTVEAWHYYDGTNLGEDPCIVTEVFPGSTSKINYALGSLNTNNPDLQSGFYTGGWTATPEGYTLTAENWYQIVGTYDGVTSKLYINGSLAESNLGSASPVSSTAGINLMKRWDGADFWGGKLAIVNIYNGDINFEGVRASWNANKARFGF